MENNIEDLIREDFHEREIKPSTHAFERLGEKLRTHIKGKQKRTLKVFAYAASIIGFVFIMQSVFKTADSNTIDTVITNAKAKDSSNLGSPKNENYSPIVVEQIDTISYKIASKKGKKPQNIKSVKTIAVIAPEKMQLKKKGPTNTGTDLSVNNLTDKERVAFNDTLKKPFIIKEITEEEIDALLASAQQSLSVKNKDSIAINSQRMLYEIEVEVNRPLPEKILLTLRTGAKEIKEIVKSKKKEN